MPRTNSQDLYATAVKTYVAQNPKSKAIHDRATESSPGGNTRSVLYYHPFPLSVQRAEGARLYDVDGHKYVDLLGEYTAGLYGHSEPVVVEAILEAARRGLNFGSQHEDEVKLATLIKERFPSIDLLRFTNSGTEATLMALAAAKAYTSREKIMVFHGAYHGGAFTFQHGGRNPVNAPHDYIIARYNSLSSVQQVLQAPENAGKVAAIIIEPMVGSGGAIPADQEFLVGLRTAATKSGAVLIFDEVMTSRMYNGGGIQSSLPEDARPDMTTLGKYIGGGMSFGCFGGKQAILGLFDPRKPDSLAHAGTFNNNVLTMAAGRAGLTKVFTPDRARQLHETGDALRRTLQEASKGTLMKVTGLGSIMCFHFTSTNTSDIKSPQDLADADKTIGSIFHLFLLDRGYYIARRGFVALSLALSEEDLNGFVEVVRGFISSYRNLLITASPEARL